MKIIMDAMGGDNAPQAPVLGAVEAAKAYGTKITLVGKGEEILDVLKQAGIEDLPSGIEICNADLFSFLREANGVIYGNIGLAASVMPRKKCQSFMLHNFNAPIKEAFL